MKINELLQIFRSVIDSVMKNQQSIMPAKKRISLADDRRKSALSMSSALSTPTKKKVTTIIAEIGGRWTRYGCVGEYYPRAFFDSNVIFNKKKHHVLNNDLEPAEKKAILVKFMKRVFTK